MKKISNPQLSPASVPSMGKDHNFKVAERLNALLEKGRAKTTLSRSDFYAQTLHVFDATLQQVEMDEFLNVACVGVEKAMDEISDVFQELLLHAIDQYYDLLGVMYMLAQLRWSRGEEYTPWDIVQLIVRINMTHFVPPTSKGQPYTFYDPCCGSGSLLLGVLEYMDLHYPELLDQGLIKVYGQEVSHIGWMMCRVNIRLHELGRFIRRPDAYREHVAATTEEQQILPTAETMQQVLFHPKP